MTSVGQHQANHIEMQNYTWRKSIQHLLISPFQFSARVAPNPWHSRICLDYPAGNRDIYRALCKRVHPTTIIILNAGALAVEPSSALARLCRWANLIGMICGGPRSGWHIKRNGVRRQWRRRRRRRWSLGQTTGPSASLIIIKERHRIHPHAHTRTQLNWSRSLRLWWYVCVCSYICILHACMHGECVDICSGFCRTIAVPNV